jgi:organic radical activating enzyme
MMNKIKADVAEIFSSVQGEGIFLGARQIFVRFKQCNLACIFCDETRDGPVKKYSPLELMSEAKFLELSSGPHHSVSLTGGEPLLHAEFLQVFLKMLVKDGMKSYLETNGTLPDELARIIDLVDIVAMDFKLPSSTGCGEFWDKHREFLKIASAKKVFVKAVVTQDTVKDDIVKAVDIIRKTRKNIPFIIQPSTPVNSSDRIVDKDKLLKFVEIGLKNNLEGVRIIPQVHKMLNIK